LLRMFDNDAYKETRNGLSVLKDLSSEAMEFLLQYIYSGNVDKINVALGSDCFPEIVYAADKVRLYSNSYENQLNTLTVYFQSYSFN
jgi:hypothetical protein